MASSSLILLTRPPAQDIRTDIQRLLRSTDPRVSNAASAILGLQQYIDSLVEALQNDLGILLASQGGAATPATITGTIASASGTIFAPDLSTANIWQFTLTGNATVNALLHPSPGSFLLLVLIQDATGGRQVTSWDASYKFPGVFGLDGTPSTASLFFFYINSASHPVLISPPVTGVASWP